ncbi:MAG: hypothetical protein KIC84_11455 [Dysgonomonas mossii]|uniref:hypothetical protein n=1 Tax=Dysgonomonas mossii TaxID=163665 RepID=UPI0026EBB777|nr:hypothetical protein [Dysgonomonas mossii]MBS5907830.1 hypothetical protein [Dysgonomonas mossii]
MEQMKEGKENAFPHIELDTYSGKPCNQHFGLTKRELFAAMAMQGILANPEKIGGKDQELTQYSVMLADALINELNKE